MLLMTYGLAKLVQALVGLRVEADVEREGLDTNLHGEEGYAFGAARAGQPTAEAAHMVAEPAFEAPR